MKQACQDPRLKKLMKFAMLIRGCLMGIQKALEEMTNGAYIMVVMQVCTPHHAATTRHRPTLYPVRHSPCCPLAPHATLIRLVSARRAVPSAVVLGRRASSSRSTRSSS